MRGGRCQGFPWGTVSCGHVADALSRLNPSADSDLVGSAVARIQRAESQDVMSENQRFHELMVRGVPG